MGFVLSNIDNNNNITMVLLSDLPTEILCMIISDLKVYFNNWNHASRAENRKPFLPFSQTNRLLWSIARPFLYHDLEILVKIENPWAAEAPKSYDLRLQTSLLCRTLQENPSLAAHARTLKLWGLLSGLYTKGGEDWSEGPRKRTELSSVSVTASELAGILVSFTNVTTFYVHGILKGDIHYGVNQLILSCMKSMVMLEDLNLFIDSGTRTDVIFHFLNAASTRLDTLSIGPHFERNLERSFTELSIDNYPVQTSKLKLNYLAIPTDLLPLAGFSSWIGNVTQLILDGLILLDGRTNQGPDIKTVLAPCASTLVHLDLHINEFFDAPSLSDFDMSQCVRLETFSYTGPWWIKPHHNPMDVYQTLFSRPYSSLALEPKDDGRHHKVRLESLKVLREAFTLAHVHNCSPQEFMFTLDFEDTEFYDQSHAEEMEEEVESLMDELRGREIEVESTVTLFDDAQYE
jgi:hypothetical protein